MAQSKCSCGNSGFEIKELNVGVPGEGPTKNKFMAIQCSSCGVVVGTHEGLYISRALVMIADHLGIKLS